MRETDSQEILTYEVIHGTFITKHKGNKKGLSQSNLYCTILSDKFMTNIYANKIFDYPILTATVRVGLPTVLCFKGQSFN